jgi:NAD(P)-dependent dehydrogenase (short-subunit alcohol dehydrogenase family)
MSQPSHRVALVTGSTSGIGAAIARRLARDGITVALHSRASVAAGIALAEELGRASYTQADLSESSSAHALIDDVRAKHGRLDILVNNAAMTQVIPHAELKSATADVWRRLYEVNVVTPWLLIAEGETMLRNSAQEGRPGCWPSLWHRRSVSMPSRPAWSTHR